MLCSLFCYAPPERHVSERHVSALLTQAETAVFLMDERTGRVALTQNQMKQKWDHSEAVGVGGILGIVYAP